MCAPEGLLLGYVAPECLLLGDFRYVAPECLLLGDLRYVCT